MRELSEARNRGLFPIAQGADLTLAADGSKRHEGISLRLGSRGFWSRHLRQWHWISSAVCLAFMLLFALTGITLNHASLFEAEAHGETREFALPQDMKRAFAALPDGSVIPPSLAKQVKKAAQADITGKTATNQYGEIVFDLAGPGRDESLIVDLNAGLMIHEVIDRGAVARFNDLHKGRHAGPAWTLLIDAAAAFIVILVITGLGLLALHARTRASTWPLTSLGLLVPVLVYLLLVH